MVERRSDGYQVQYLRHSLVDDSYVEYIFKIVAPGDFSFSIKDRYSSIRSFYSIVKK